MSEKSLPTLATELFELVRDYAKQQLVEPIKGVGRFVAWGLAGALLLGIGLVLLAVGLLRVLQTETGDAFDGNFTWVPYVIVVAAAALLVALVMWRVVKRKGSGL